MSEIKVGEKVLVVSSGWTTAYAVNTVERETKTQWILPNNDKYRKDNLRRVGDIGHAWVHFIQPMTPDNVVAYNEWLDERQHKSLWSKFKELNRPAHLSVERLQEIYDELKGETIEK